MPSSSSVSAKPLTTVSGVLSSCETFATKSRRTVSRRRSVREVEQREHAAARRAAAARSTATVRPCERDLALDGVVAPASAVVDRLAERRGRAAAARAGRGAASRDAQQRAGARVVDANDLPRCVERDDALVQRLEQRAVMQLARPPRARRGASQSCSAMRCSAVARSPDLARRRERRPALRGRPPRWRVRRRAARRRAARCCARTTTASSERDRRARSGRHEHVALRAARRSRRGGACCSDTRTKPSGVRTARRTARRRPPTGCAAATRRSPRERASTISGRLRWFSSRRQRLPVRTRRRRPRRPCGRSA